jgi:acyl dehydratase
MVDVIKNIDEFEVEYNKQLGKDVPLKANADASKDNIVLFADAIGDSNPLWSNEDYAKKSRYGSIIAPPMFFYKINHGTLPAEKANITLPIENIAGMYSGAEFEFYKPVFAGDSFTIKAKAYSIVRKDTKTRGPILFTQSEVFYFNQRGDKVAMNRSLIAKVPISPDGPKAGVKQHDPAKPGVVAKSPDVLAFERKRRGNKPRYWEEVKEGQEMEPVERGVLTATEITRFTLFVANMPPRILQKREGLEIGFQREAYSRSHHGTVDAEDFGPQRTSWLSEIVTDWMGDDATLKKFSCQIRGSNMLGDINVTKGKVVKKYIENEEHLVDVEMWVQNQGDVITAPGKATILLPTKK